MAPTTDAFGDACDYLAGVIRSAERRAERVAAYLNQHQSLGDWCRRNESPPLVREVLIALGIALQLETCELAGARATLDYDFPDSETVLAGAWNLAGGNPAAHNYRELNAQLLLWSARHLSWVGLHDRPIRLDPSVRMNPDEFLATLAELLLESHHSLEESKSS